jgi:hypothetical protein
MGVSPLFPDSTDSRTQWFAAVRALWAVLDEGGSLTVFPRQSCHIPPLYKDQVFRSKNGLREMTANKCEGEKCELEPGQLSPLRSGVGFEV